MPKKVLTKKVMKLFCTILSLAILLLPFNIICYASNTENLIDSDLRNWSLLFPEETSGYTNVFYRSRVYQGVTYSSYGFTSTSIPIEGNSNKMKASYIYDLTPLISGNSYSFKFHLLSLEEAQFITPNLSEESYYGGLLNGNGSYYIGLGSYVNEDNIIAVEDACIRIDKTNYLSFYGKDNTITFELPNISNPCIVISYGEVSPRNYSQHVYINDISLVDNEQAKEDSFFSRLFEWFQEKFDVIGESFSNLGNKLTELKDGFVNKITELKDSFLNSISNLGNTIGSFFDQQLQGIQNFFRGFGNLILYFNWNGDYTNPFSDTNITVSNGADNTEHIILAVDEFNDAVDNLTHYLSVPSKMLKKLGEELPIVPIIVVFSLVGLVVMRLFGVRRDN